MYLYNIHGELIKETRTTAGQIFVTEYGYTGNGEVAYMIYPSGRRITWNRDTTGQLSSVQSLYEGKTGLLAENISSKPFGPVSSLETGNGLTLSRSFDSLYRLSGITAGRLYERTYTYWSDGLVQDIVDPIGTDHAYSYDDLGQLDTASLPAGAFDFDHDGTGNRLSRTVDSSDVTGYSYVTGTNRLDQSTGAVAAAYGYDASGNIATDSTETTVYDLTDDQRLASVTKNSVTVGAYQYDGRGLRTVKTVNGEDTLFVSCKSGRLIAEADSDGNITKEYIYLEGDIFAHFQYEVPAAVPEEAIAVSEPSAEEIPEPVLADNPPAVAATSMPSDTAFLQPIFFLLLLQNKSAEGAYYYINDHLGAPQIITDDSGSVVWQAEYLPFGKVNISVAQIENNLRFPGQYYDAETGLHYNWNRYYDPETGRYIAADPIGLGGGMNLYAYVGSDPVNAVDPLGLASNGGPWHPPKGVKTGCKGNDTCPQLRNKIELLNRMIRSHEYWDRHMPAPRGGGRHSDEITQLKRSLAKCERFYRNKKCQDDCDNRSIGEKINELSEKIEKSIRKGIERGTPAGGGVPLVIPTPAGPLPL